jgi:predicted nucleotidyltransferase
VPIKQIKTIYKPVEKLKYLLRFHKTPLEKLIIKFVKLLSYKSEIHISNFGVSGSSLIGLETVYSDVDLVVYGKNEGKKVYDTLSILRKEIDWISPYNEKTIEEILNSRWGASGLDLKKISQIEENKILHGKLNDIDYFIRLINLSESLEMRSIPIKKIITRVKVIDSSESIYTPCRYFVESIQSENKYDITELLSYRGKFTEQVKEGIVEVKGTLEKVAHPDGAFYRIVMGYKGDYLVPINVM